MNKPYLFALIFIVSTSNGLPSPQNDATTEGITTEIVTVTPTPPNDHTARNTGSTEIQKFSDAQLFFTSIFDMIKVAAQIGCIEVENITMFPGEC